ncbi:helix-turn-helix transcriptional regulator [Streptomyces chartreusis]|uniref:Response regulator transcription factor n=1 Tax=Streptomyces chartreusis TaxID=1969 RepID=A0A7H8T0X2_STRCX|nr:LuxR C-terminal-related transcriptional regulator [Streptomyces chartreusis]QKZ17167.1 response regulator transcription factor [Streptomyces chartreusis]
MSLIRPDEETASVFNHMDVRLAVSIGVFVDAKSPAEVLKVIVEHTGAEMAQLDTWNGGRAAPLAVHDCPAEVSRVLSEEIPHDRFFGRHLLAAESACLSDDPGLGFGSSAYFRECFGPAGVAAGVAMALHDMSGRLAGLLYLASTRPGHFGERHRVLFGTLMPVLARAAAPPAPSAELIPRGYAASRIRGDLVETTEFRQPAKVADDPHIRELARRFARHSVPYLQFLWPSEDGWFDVVLVRETGDWQATIVACRPTDLPWRLTHREIEVLTTLAAGATNRQIASTLSISERTAMTHVENILQKLSAPGRTAAAVRAVREGIIVPSADPASPGSLERLLGPYLTGR